MAGSKLIAESSSPGLPLSGVHVVEIGPLIATPLAGMILADYGADVVKIEPLEGDPARALRNQQLIESSGPWNSPFFLAFNRGKRCIALDLKSKRGTEIANRLTRVADVVIQGQRPGVMERLGLGPDQLMNSNPRLVYGSLSAFGRLGPEAERGGVDLVMQAESGIMSVTGAQDGPPTKVGFTVIDHAAGHILAQGILAALLKRERIGRGDHVCVSLLEVGLALQAQPFDEYLATGAAPARIGNSAPVTAPAGVFRTRDGHIVLSASNERHWQTLCELLGRPDWLGDQRFATAADRDQHRGVLTTELEESLETGDSAYWLAKFLNAGLAAGQVKDYTQLELSPQLIAIGAIAEISGENHQTLRHTRLPVRLMNSLPQTARVPPRLGQHTREILREIGYSPNDIDSLLAAQVVRDDTDV